MYAHVLIKLKKQLKNKQINKKTQRKIKSPKSLMVRDRVIMACLFFPTFLPNGACLSTIDYCLKNTLRAVLTSHNPVATHSVTCSS